MSDKNEALIYKWNCKLYKKTLFRAAWSRERVVMSTAIDPHLIVLCISKAGQHLRTTVRGADLSARPGLKPPSGNPSNSSLRALSHLKRWQDLRTSGGSLVMWAGRSRAALHFIRRKLFKENPSRNTLYSTRYHLERVRTGLTLCIVTLCWLFKAEHSTIPYCGVP